jgi:hypothetical protein
MRDIKVTEKKDDSGESIFDDFAALAEDARGAIETIRDGVTKDNRRALPNKLEGEAVDSSFATRMRSIIEKVSREGGVTLTMTDEGTQIRMIIGEGTNLRVYQGSSLTAALDMAEASEK